MVALGLFEALPNDILEHIHFFIHKNNMENVFEIIHTYVPEPEQTAPRFTGYRLSFRDDALSRNLRLYHKNKPCFTSPHTCIESRCVTYMLDRRNGIDLKRLLG